MKLKKIASLALAGVMAVSMLAGCGTKAPETGDNGDQGEVETTIDINKVLNDAQTGKVKVNFTANADMDLALQYVLAQNGVKGISVSNLKLPLKNFAGIEATDPEYGAYKSDVAGLVNGKLGYYYTTGAGSLLDGDDSRELDGKTYTAVNYVEFTSYTDETVFKAMAQYLEDNVYSKLDAHSLMTYASMTDLSNAGYGNIPTGTELKSGIEGKNMYYTYSYTGNAQVVTKLNANGTTTYGLLYVINQTLNEVAF